MEAYTYKYTRIYRDMTEDKIKKDSQDERDPLDLSIYPKDEKGRLIVPEEIIKDRYKELPDGAHTEDRSYTAFNGGLLRQLTEEERRAGGKARQEKKAKIETFAAAIKRALYSSAKAQTCEKLGIPKDSSNLEAIIAAQLGIASSKDKGTATKAAEFIRDTIGEKPAEKQEITADIMTDEDRALLQKVRARQIKAEQAEQELSDQ